MAASDHRRRRPILRGAIAIALAGTLVPVACTRIEPETERRPTISEDVFVEAMIALRTSFALDDQGVLAPGASDAILQDMGLAPEQLETFVEVHGGNVPLMADIWSRIEVAVDSAAGRTLQVEGDADTQGVPVPP